MSCCRICWNWPMHKAHHNNNKFLSYFLLLLNFWQQLLNEMHFFKIYIILMTSLPFWDPLILASIALSYVVGLLLMMLKMLCSTFSFGTAILGAYNYNVNTITGVFWTLTLNLSKMFFELAQYIITLTLCFVW